MSHAFILYLTKLHIHNPAKKFIPQKKLILQKNIFKNPCKNIILNKEKNILKIPQKILQKYNSAQRKIY